MGRTATVKVPKFKLAVPMNAASLPRDLVPPDGPPGEPVLDMTLEGGNPVVRAQVSGRNYRKMLKQIDENGPENMAVILQGVLLPPASPGEPFTLAEAGFQAVVKTPKPNPSSPALDGGA